MFNLVNVLRYIVLTTSMLTLFACGGGGGSGVSSSGAFTVGGTVNGLTNDVTLTLNGGAPIIVTPANSDFTFTNQAINEGIDYIVAVSVDPAGQTCSVAGNGKMGTANVTTVVVTCTNIKAGTYTIGGLVSGLTGTVSLNLNGAAVDMDISQNGRFTFTDTLTLGDAYAVITSVDPVGQICEVVDGNGIISDNVINISVNCFTPTYTVGGKVTGHRGDVILSLNGGAALTVVHPNDSFTFINQALNIDDTFTVAVDTAPAGQTCVVTGNGKIGRADVTDVSVACSNIGYTIGGKVLGLNTGNPISLSLNNGASFSIAADGGFIMPTPVDIENDYAYSVKVSVLPAGQTCTVTGGENSNGTGFASANVTSIVVTCIDIPYTIGGSVSGLNASSSVSLSLNGTASSITVNKNGGFTFPNVTLGIGKDYLATVTTQPAGQTCTVPAVKQVVDVNVTDINVVCTNNAYTVGGIGTFTGTGLTLSLNGGAALAITSGVQFTFSNQPLNITNNYTVSIVTSPAGLTCSLTNGSGQIGSSNVTNVGVSCATTVYTIGGSVTGLGAGKSVVLLNNGSDPLTVSATTPFTFKDSIGTGTTYNVTVMTHPADQFCTPAASASGTANANVLDVSLSCVNVYDVRVDVSGLKGTVTFLNGGIEYPVSVNGLSDIVLGLKDTDPYAVTIKTTPSGQPDGQTCTLTPNAAGPTIGPADETISVVCTDEQYTVGGSITGTLTGEVRLILTKNTVDFIDVPFTALGRFDFPLATQSLIFNDDYEVRVATQPVNETCFVDAATAIGKMGTASVTNVAVDCLDNTLDADLDGRPDAEERLTCPSTTVDPYCSLRGNKDTDNDKHLDGADAFPNDFSEWQDTDGDKIGNNADLDDDGDKVADLNDFFPLDGTRWAKVALNLATLNGANGFILNGINENDLSGASVSSADVNGDGIADLIIGANFAEGNNSRGYDEKPAVGETYVVFGNGDPAYWTTILGSFDLSTLNGKNGFVIKGDRGNDQSGVSVSGIGDINGDTIADFIIGAAYADTDSAPNATTPVTNDIKNAGQTYVVYGKTVWDGAGGPAPLDAKGIATLDLSSLGSNGFVINGISDFDLSGYAVKDAGDINNDGVSDMIIGARGAAFSTGHTYVLFGRTVAWPSSFDLSTLSSDATAANGFVIKGIAEDDFSGWSVSAAGRFNGDAFDDLLVSSRGASANGVGNAGETYVIYGKSATATWTPVINLSTDLTAASGLVIYGITAGDKSGSSVSAAGDINDDGADDIIIGAELADPDGLGAEGESYVIFGRTATDTAWPATFSLSTLTTGAGADGFIIKGLTKNDQNGSAVSGAGDVNGDGIADIMIGVSLGDPNTFTDSGETYVIFGRALGTAWSQVFDLATLDGLNGFTVNGIDQFDNSGIAVSGAGDVNGDGIVDLIIGASNADPNGKASGETYVVFGCMYISNNNAKLCQK